MVNVQQGVNLMCYLLKSLDLSGFSLKRTRLKTEELKGAGAFLKEHGAVHWDPKPSGAEFNSISKAPCRAKTYTKESSQQEIGMVPF